MKLLKKAQPILFAFLLLMPVLSIGSGANSEASLEAFQKGNVDDMTAYIKTYLGTSKGKEQIERYYQPWIQNKRIRYNQNVQLEWGLFPTYFCNQDPAEFLMILDELLMSCQNEQGKEICKTRSVSDYASHLLKSEQTKELHVLSHEQLVQLLNIDLGISTSSGTIWGVADGEFEGMPDNYLELRKQYKMVYPFKEKFVLYAPYGYSEIYGETKHLGADLNKSPDKCCGIEIYSVSSGVVTYKGQDVHGANLLMVKTGDVSIMYAHMAQPSPYVAGEVINKGDFVGYVGTTGYSTGCHLHLEMRYKNVVINPEVFIDLKNAKPYD